MPDGMQRCGSVVVLAFEMLRRSFSHTASTLLREATSNSADGAGLMLVPIYLGLCAPDKTTMNHAAATTLMAGNMTAAIWVSGVHTLAMTTAGGILAILMYVWLGLRFLSKTFFNLDIVWALSLVLVGAFGVYSAVAS